MIILAAAAWLCLSNGFCFNEDSVVRDGRYVYYEAALENRPETPFRVQLDCVERVETFWLPSGGSRHQPFSDKFGSDVFCERS